ncbi:MAG: non-heme iron oxygenase ferredoxin subunit [Burkholderiaceae bacterium]
MEEITLIEADFVESGTVLRVDVQGLPPLAVFNLDGEYFVCDDTCSHGQASLSEGSIEGDRIECPWHNGQFCIRTGAALAGPVVAPIVSYPVTLKDGMVCIAARRDKS